MNAVTPENQISNGHGLGCKKGYFLLVESCTTSCRSPLWLACQSSSGPHTTSSRTEWLAAQLCGQPVRRLELGRKHRTSVLGAWFRHMTSWDRHSLPRYFFWCRKASTGSDFGSSFDQMYHRSSTGSNFEKMPFSCSPVGPVESNALLPSLQASFVF